MREAALPHIVVPARACKRPRNKLQHHYIFLTLPLFDELKVLAQEDLI